VIVHVNTHDCIVLPTEAPKGKRNSWVEVPRLPVPFTPVIEWIKLLAGHGLMSMMAIFDFLSRHITPL
jgi:hypothetical protein